MKKEEFQQFLHDLCADVTGRELDFSWRKDRDNKPTILVGPLLEPKAAEELLNQLQKQDIVKFRVASSAATPGFSRLVASTDTIKGIDESIAKILNQAYKASIPMKKEYSWQQITNSNGESCVAIRLNFSRDYAVDYTDPGLSLTEMGLINHQLAELARKLEFRFGIKTDYEEHKSGDYFNLESVTYKTYIQLREGGPSLVDILLSNSFLNNTPTPEAETVTPPVQLQLP